MRTTRCEKSPRALNPCSSREAWACRQTLRTQSPLPGSSVCSAGSWSTQQWRDRYQQPGITHALLATSPADTMPAERPRWERQSVAGPHASRPQPSVPCLSSSPGFPKQWELLHCPSFHPPCCQPSLNSFWTHQMIWNWGKSQVPTTSTNWPWEKLGRTHLLLLGRSQMSKYLLTVNRTVRVQLQMQRRCCLLPSHRGQGGNSWDSCRGMGRAEAASKASILPNHPSLVLLLVETWGLFSIQEKPTGKSMPFPKLCSSTPLQVMQSAPHTGVPRDHRFDGKQVWWECNPAALCGICTAETRQCKQRG